MAKVRIHDVITRHYSSCRRLRELFGATGGDDGDVPDGGAAGKTFGAAEDFACTAKESPRQLRGATLGRIKMAERINKRKGVDEAGSDPAHPESERGGSEREAQGGPKSQNCQRPLPGAAKAMDEPGRGRNWTQPDSPPA